MRGLIRYILLSALRDHLFVGILCAFLGALGLSYFFGATSLVESEAMTTVLLASTGRLITIIGTILCISFMVHRDYETHSMDVILSRPLSRYQVIMGFFIGFLVISSLFVATLTLLLFLCDLHSLYTLLLWGVTLWCETIIVASFTLFCALMLKNAVSSVLLSLAFYSLSRLMGVSASLIHASPPLSWETMPMWLVQHMVSFIALLTPRLDLFAESNWLIYGMETSTVFTACLVQAMLYVPLLLIMTCIDMRRKEL